MEFKVKAATEDPATTIIEKTWSRVDEFTVAAVRNHVDYLKKKQVELSAQKQLEEAKMSNYVSYHPFLEKLTTEEIMIAKLHGESLTLKMQCEEGLVKIEAQLAEYATETAEIESQTGIKI